jgi:hypothetical protein
MTTSFDGSDPQEAERFESATPNEGRPSVDDFAAYGRQGSISQRRRRVDQQCRDSQLPTV